MALEFMIDVPCAVAVEQVVQALNDTGFRVEQSFDLRSAMALIPDCSCQYHGTSECDCQYVVLLVYESAHAPATLVTHGHDGRSWVVVAEIQGGRLNAALRRSIERTLSSLIASRG